MVPFVPNDVRAMLGNRHTGCSPWSALFKVNEQYSSCSTTACFLERPEGREECGTFLCAGSIPSLFWHPGIM